MRLLVALGETYDADRLVPITSAHIAGASYKMVGDPGLEFIEDFARDARVTVPATPPSGNAGLGPRGRRCGFSSLSGRSMKRTG